MVKIYCSLIFLLFILSCEDVSQKPDKVNIAVWGNWSSAEISNPVDYKSTMALAPLYYRYLFDKNPDYSVLKYFVQRGDTINFAVQEQLYWDNGTAISVSDVIRFFNDVLGSSIETLDINSNTGSFLVSGSVPCSWYFHAPFSLDKSHGGNGLYKISKAGSNSLILSLKDSTLHRYPLGVDYTFLGDQPETSILKPSKFDLILQLPISYFQEQFKLPGFRLHKKERRNLALLLFNTEKISKYGYYREVINQQIDREVLTDAILWSYATPRMAGEIPGLKKDKKSNLLPVGENKRDIKILINRNPMRIKVLQEISTQISPSYFSIIPEIVDWQIYKQRLRTKDFDAVFLEWTFNSFLDIFEFWASEDEFSAASLTNISGGQLKEKLLSFRENWDANRKKQYFEELNQKIYEIYPVVYLYSQNFLYLYNEKMKMDVAPDNWFKNLSDWQLEAKHE